MILKNVKTDFQVTGWVVNNIPVNPIKRFLVNNILENFPKTLNYLADNCYSNNENRAIFLVNYYSPKYDKAILGLNELEINGYELNTDNKGVFIGLTKNHGNSWLYICNGAEVLPWEGHFIAAGASYNPKYKPKEFSHGPSLEIKLKEAKDNDALIIAAHPLPELNSFSKFYLEKIAKDPSGPHLGLNEESIESFSNYFDALEVYSFSMSLNQGNNVKQLANKLNLPVVANSDGEISQSFSSYNQFDYIDFSSPEKMRESIRKGLKRNNNNYKIVINPSKRNLDYFLDIAKHAALPLLCGHENY